ncbi:MAG: ribose-5-phosphate isomerase RpiA [Candidatus Caldarchaeum sp.]
MEKAKVAAARAATAFVEDGMVVGLGSGSTASVMLAEIAKQGKRISVIPASSQTYLEAVNSGLQIATLETNPQPDLYLDSFDQVDHDCNMIKGGGAALMREKVLASASRLRIFAGESRKLSRKLNKPIPLEVLPFALGYVMKTVERLGASITIRMAQTKNGPTVTDNGNYVIDASFGEITEPDVLEQRLRKIPGLLENGLFVGLADAVFIAYVDGRVEEMKRKSLNAPE